MAIVRALVMPVLVNIIAAVFQFGILVMSYAGDLILSASAPPSSTPQ